MTYLRIVIAIITGAILGVFCIIGVGLRLFLSQTLVGNEWYLIGMWYNRVVMGLLIGLAGGIIIVKWKPDVTIGSKTFVFDSNVIPRGLILGLIVSSAIFISSGFIDITAFFAGIVYGLIIDFLATHGPDVWNLIRNKEEAHT